MMTHVPSFEYAFALLRALEAIRHLGEASSCAGNELSNLAVGTTKDAQSHLAAVVKTNGSIWG